MINKKVTVTKATYKKRTNYSSLKFFADYTYSLNI